MGLKFIPPFQGLNFFMIDFTGLHPVLMYFALSELGTLTK